MSREKQNKRPYVKFFQALVRQAQAYGIMVGQGWRGQPSAHFPASENSMDAMSRMADAGGFFYCFWRRV